MNIFRNIFVKKSKKEIHPVGWSAIAGLLEDLGKVGVVHEEIFDTDVREKMWDHLNYKYIKMTPNYKTPKYLGMFSDEANEMVLAVLEENEIPLMAIIEAFKLNTEEKRFVTFTNPKVKSGENGYYLDDFFGSP